jgi:hypothetical protein
LRQWRSKIWRWWPHADLELRLYGLKSFEACCGVHFKEGTTNTATE